MRQFWVGPPSNGLFSHFLSDVPSRFQDEKENPIEAKLKGLDLLRMTPIEALNTLYELKTEIEHNK